jgi:hypothetical protein
MSICFVCFGLCIEIHPYSYHPDRFLSFELIRFLFYRPDNCTLQRHTILSLYIGDLHRDSVLGIGVEGPGIVDFGYNNTSICSVFVLILDSTYKLQHLLTEGFSIHPVVLALILLLKFLPKDFYIAVKDIVHTNHQDADWAAGTGFAVLD